jgi:glycine/D-amino acid oxidase-like deaminating enzyme
MVLLSDLFVDADDLLRGLRRLRQRGHDVLVLHVLDDDELDFPFSGPTRFEGLETDQQLSCNPRALRQGYLDALESFLATVRRGCARDRIDYALVRTSEPLDAALVAFLSQRNHRHGR